jgi:hypothetical protein
LQLLPMPADDRRMTRLELQTARYADPLPNPHINKE